MYVPAPMAARSPASIVGSNPTRGMDVCLLCVLSGRERSLRRADNSSKRGPTDCGASLCVITKPRVTRRP
jgi:hypothetical protein